MEKEALINHHQYHSFYCTSYNNQRSSIFFRPKLRIEFDEHKEQDVFGPARTFYGYRQKYLKIRVRNIGNKMVHNCKAQLKVRIPQNDNPLRYPSSEPKPLTWGQYPHVEELHDVGNIQVQGSEYLHIVFSDSDFATTPVAAPTRYACISTIERLQQHDLRPDGMTNNLTVQDSFTDGEFDVDILITSDEGPRARASFRIHVDKDYMALSMKKNLSPSERLKAKLNSLFTKWKKEKRK